MELSWDQRGRGLPVDGKTRKILLCPGVYAIRNKKTGDMYIGSSLNVYVRMVRIVSSRSNRVLKKAIADYGLMVLNFWFSKI